MTASSIRSHIVLILLGSLLCACRRPAAPAATVPGAIEGHIAASTRLRVADHRITLRLQPGGTLAASTKTDAKGRFRLQGVSPGDYLLESDVEGQAAAVSLSVQPGETLFTVLRLQDPLQLVGQVVDRNGNPVPAAVVLVWRTGQATTQAKETSTNEKGGFVIDQMAAGNVTLLVQAPGIGSVKWDPVSLPSRHLHISLAGIGFSLSGKVTSSRGPEQQATVRLGGVGVRTVRPTTTAADGSFKFHGLGPGDYALRAGSVTLASATAKVVISDADVANAALTLGPGEVVSGNVVDGQRKALTGATVVIASVPPDDCPEVLAVDVVGYFSTIALPRGPYQVSARMPGFVAEAPQQVNVNGRPGALSIQLFRAGRVFGRLLAANGKPAVGAEVSVTSPSGPRYPRDRLPVVAGSLPLAAEAAALGTQLLPHVMRRRSVTVDQTGAFSLGELRPGSYGLSARAGDGKLSVAPREVKEAAGTDFGSLTMPVTAPRLVASAPVVVAGNRKLVGVVKDPKGRPLINASIAVSTTLDPTGEFVSSISGAKGEFSFGELPNDKALVLNARHATFGSASKSIGVDDKTVALQFQNPGGIEGEVVDERGRFVQGAQVSLQASDGSAGPAVQMSGAGFRCLGVPPGVWTLVVSSPQVKSPIRQTITVPPGTNAAVASLRGLRLKVVTAP